MSVENQCGLCLGEQWSENFSVCCGIVNVVLSEELYAACLMFWGVGDEIGHSGWGVVHDEDIGDSLCGGCCNLLGGCGFLFEVGYAEFAPVSVYRIRASECEESDSLPLPAESSGKVDDVVADWSGSIFCEREGVESYVVLVISVYEVKCDIVFGQFLAGCV